MPTISITIPEADVAKVKAAVMAITGLPETATSKQLLAALIKSNVVKYERETAVIAPLEIE